MTRIFTMAGLAAVLLAGCAAQPPAPVVDRNLGATAAPPAIAPKPEERVPTYTVKPGETLYSIAAQNRIDPRDLAAWNGISDPTKVQSGQVLRLRAPEATAASAGSAGGAQTSPIAGMGGLDARPFGAEAAVRTDRPASGLGPTAGSAPVKTEPKAVRLPYSDENLAALQSGGTARAPGAKAEVAAAAAATTRPSAAADDPDRVDWSWPVSGKLVTGFSEATKGVEIGARNGEPVYASAGGRVVYSGSGLRGYGKLVIIKHNEKYLSAYGNNRRLLVKEGDAVTKGQKIAEVGSDGGAAKLHFEIRQLGKPVDPMKFLPER